MQIVIEVPDDFYERVNKDGCMSYTDAEVVVNAVYRGIVLPKGHGALKDTDALVCRHTIESGPAVLWAITRIGLETAPTIIPADKERYKCLE